MAYVDRTYATLYPEVDKVVMIQVKAIDDNGASVSLLEFDNIEGRIQDPFCRHLTTVDRIEPAIVRDVRISRGDDGVRRVSISLSRDGFSGVERRACELRFLEGKHVQSIMRKVAMSFEKSDLGDIDNFSLLPSLEVLSNKEFQATLPKRLRKKLKKAVRKVIYSSWRMGGSRRGGQEDPFLILPSSLKQLIGLCWAITLVRHFEAVLKLNHKLDWDKHLSIQDLINKTPGLTEEGDLDRLEDAGKILTRYGIVLEEECPLTFQVPNEDERARLRAVVTGAEYRAKSVNVIHNNIFLTIERIKTCVEGKTPVTASVIWFDSYNKNNPSGTDIYRPTEEEWKAYKRNPYDRKLVVHTMLLTGSGTDEHGTSYWEFLDGTGDINNGDRGFLRFIQIPGMIIELVEIEIEV